LPSLQAIEGKIMNQDAPEQAQASFRLMYRSRDLIPPEDRKVALGDLFSEARSKNKRRQISGALLISDQWFVQTLEGDEDAVLALYARIKSDPRHDSVSLLSAEQVSGAVFSRWSMARVSEEVDEADTFLLAHRDGISPAASLRPTPEQDSVLDVMRAAARGGPVPVGSAATSAATPSGDKQSVGRGGALSM
jgi:hypothetical protein